MARIDFRGVRKEYPGGVVAVHGLDLSVEDGELVALVGPSGCGKSTLLRMLAGLETLSAGEIRIGDRVVNDLEPAERDIAMVFQNYALYPHMSVRDNLAYGLRNRRTPKVEIARRLAEVARILEIEGLLDRKPRQLSGGQRQRVAMGRAIVREPQAFLFDEPLSNLDAKLRGQMRIEIKALQRRLATTSLYVTHDQVEAMTLGDRLLVLNGGVVEQLGTPIELYARPATHFVAGFIGSPPMNFLAARLTPDGRPVTLGVRPEHLRPGAAAEAAFVLTVELVEPLGAETLVHGRLQGAQSPLTARLPGIATVAAGDVVTLAAAAADLHLFDAKTGVRIDGDAVAAVFTSS